MSRPGNNRLVPMVSVAVALIALTAGGFIAADRYKNRIASEVITRPAPELGPMAHLLLPNLDGATVVVVDRPHDPAEVRAEDRFARIGRRRSFQVWTNSLGLRGPELPPEKTGPRVLCVGDSVTFGWGVPVEDSYPVQLAQRLGVEVVNAGVPAMKPNTISKWTVDNARSIQPDLVLFTRRPDWNTPDPWADYVNAVRAAARAVAPAPLGVVMPPVSTFDAMGSQQFASEAARATQLLAPIPVLDLTPAFRAALPLPGVTMTQTPGRQIVRRYPGDEVLVDAADPGHGLATEITDLFESDHDIAEPLFFDGGHPDQPGFVLFADEVAAWVRAQGWLQ